MLALVAGGSVALGVVGWSLLSSPSDPAAGSVPSVLVRPRTTQSAATPTVGASPSTPDSVPATGRDPFDDEEPSVSTGRATAPHVEPSPTPTASPTSVPAPSPGATADGVGSSTVTVTVGPTYVGLYAWNGSRASFRVNARTYSVHVGTTFGPGLRFTAVVPGTPECAKVQHGQDSFTLCPGQFTALT